MMTFSIGENSKQTLKWKTKHFKCFRSTRMNSSSGNNSNNNEQPKTQAQQINKQTVARHSEKCERSEENKCMWEESEWAS